jgi:hypothetical protein
MHQVKSVSTLFVGIMLFLLNTTAIAEQPATPADQTKSLARDCGNTVKARFLAELIINDPLQRRKDLNCHPLLTEIALAKAKEMASLGRVDHIGRNPANRRLVHGGYPLANIYPTFLENNVEAIAGGFSDASEVWEIFKNSEAHRTHLLALHEFYELQNDIGVAFYYDKNTPHIEYWAVYVAHQDSDKDYKGEIAKSKD